MATKTIITQTTYHVEGFRRPDLIMHHGFSSEGWRLALSHLSLNNPWGIGLNPCVEFVSQALPGSVPNNIKTVVLQLLPLNLFNIEEVTPDNVWKEIGGNYSGHKTGWHCKVYEYQGEEKKLMVLLWAEANHYRMSRDVVSTEVKHW